MRRRFLLSTAAADLSALLLALVAASYVTFRVAPWQVQLSGGRSIMPLAGFFVVGSLVGSLISARMWAGAAPRPSYGRGMAIVIFGVAFTALAVIGSASYLSRTFFAVTAVTWLIGGIAQRAIRRRRPWTESMIVITNEKGLIDDLRDAEHTEVLALMDPAASGELEAPAPGATVVVDLRAVLSDRMAQFVSSAALAGIPVRALSSVYEEHTGRMPLVHLAEGWELSTPVTKTAPIIGGKFIFDVLAVIVSAPLSIPLGLLIALAIRLDSPGPVIFRQVRTGRHGVPFTLYKFRTMVVDAEAAGPKFASKEDPRLTRVGRLLRRVRVDELPQLFNVLKGDLSLVGPRPEQVPFTEHFRREIPFYEQRHLVRPGVTGWAQVNYGYADDQAEAVDKLTYDLYYVKHMSPWLDLHILGRSIWTVLSGFGAR